MRAVVLLSGGLDSTTALAKAVDDGYDEIIALTCLYGSKHNLTESAAADAVIEHYKEDVRVTSIEHKVVWMPDIFKGGDSALFAEDGVPMPHLTYKEIAEGQGPSPTVVPFRNANLISVATTVAVTKKAEAVYVGMHAEDARGWAYPDCTPEFLGAMANAVFVGTYQQVRLVFPLIWLLKTEVVMLGTALEAPLELTYSCYEGGPVHCGECPTCVERRNAFAEAGIEDPTEYMLPDSLSRIK